MIILVFNIGAVSQGFKSRSPITTGFSMGRSVKRPNRGLLVRFWFKYGAIRQGAKPGFPLIILVSIWGRSVKGSNRGRV